MSTYPLDRITEKFRNGNTKTAKQSVYVIIACENYMRLLHARSTDADYRRRLVECMRRQMNGDVAEIADHSELIPLPFRPEHYICDDGEAGEGSAAVTAVNQWFAKPMRESATLRCSREKKPPSGLRHAQYS